ncbi:uncharacterized protein BXZ73DRAFT_102366 [Epithele typhae]|uniref:uncharacterized protein n=1 Tax=Epithele typhae TaxID=378194 RepID=UPI0020079A7C|nr:uncharacterized protein BXZ73DRAFT_102366 [Epithele typhae]KAH9928526.1 hypothetical protein BXZ73DRAFT_102366 [Epithele typhae]
MSLRSGITYVVPSVCLVLDLLAPVSSQVDPPRNGPRQNNTEDSSCAPKTTTDNIWRLLASSVPTPRPIPTHIELITPERRCVNPTAVTNSLRAGNPFVSPVGPDAAAVKSWTERPYASISCPGSNVREAPALGMGMTDIWICSSFEAV